MNFDEADERLAAGWHVDLAESNPQDSAQRMRFLKQVPMDKQESCPPEQQNI